MPLVVIQIRVSDPQQLAPYAALAQASLDAHGIRRVARSTEVEVLEGSPAGSMFVVLEGDTVEQVRAWYSSPEYAEAARARAGIAEFTTVVL
jgi:uncharacterized protein (DUF1330 family)